MQNVMENNLLQGLNPQQKLAVEYFDKPLLVLAGAGSGKTSVLTKKIAYLVQNRGVHASQILAITFTKKAATEMKERVQALLGYEPQWVLTFHSLCLKILRQTIEALGKQFTRKFTIYDEDDSKKIIKETMKELGMDVKNVDEAKTIISRAKQEWCPDIAAVIAKLPEPLSLYAPVADVYQRTLEKSNALDFDDLVFFVVDIFTKMPEVKKHWQSRFSYLLVDEFQDTNKVQYELVTQLSGGRKNITAVADSWQCIYTWRSANPEQVFQFVEDFGAHTQKLERNYRSTKMILQVANKVIANSDSPWEKLTLWTDKDEDGVVEGLCHDDNQDEISFIADEINRLVRQGYTYNDLAILLRMNFLSRGIEHTFVRYGIPYEIIGGLSFYDRLEVKDCLSYLKLMINRRDKAAFERIVNVPARGLGAKALGDIRCNYKTDWIQALRDTKLPPKQRAATDKFIQTIEQYGSLIEVAPCEALLGMLKDTGYQWHLEKHYTEDSDARMLNVSELANVLRSLEQQGKTFSEFLEDTLLSSEQDNLTDTDKVKVMTIHGAKGLEFPVVFVIAMEEEIFPTVRSYQSAEALEEERRLCYVAVTRAKERLYLSHAEERMKFGQIMQGRPSRYFVELEAELSAASLV